MKSLTTVLCTALAAPAGAQTGEILINFHGGKVYRFVESTGEFTPFSQGTISPAYGWPVNGFIMMPTLVSGIIFRVEISSGAVSVLTAGENLVSTVSFVQNLNHLRCFVSELANNMIVEVWSDGRQAVWLDNSSGLLNGPAGIAFDKDDNLYIGNFLDGKILKVDWATRTPVVLSDGAGLTASIAGIALDGAGNLFAADFVTHNIVRVDTETGATELFASDPLITAPRDLRVQKKGRLLVTSTGSDAMLAIDDRGQVSIVVQDSSPGGAWQGILAPDDYPLCTGELIRYGQGTPGTAGVVPEMRGVFWPCRNSTYAVQVSGAPANGRGFFLIGAFQGNLPAFGGTVLVDFIQPWTMVVLPHAADGTLHLTLQSPDDDALIGLSLYFQELILDPGAPQGLSMTNGLQVLFGE